MHAVITSIQYLPGTTEDAAVGTLYDLILPGVKQAPGFVKGVWAGDDKVATALMVFETEDQAKQALQGVGDEVGGVKVTSSDVYRVHAEL
jgi:hypothetical protein